MTNNFDTWILVFYSSFWSMRNPIFSNSKERVHFDFNFFHYKMFCDPWFTKDIKESGNIASLHKQIAACDTILEVKNQTMTIWLSQLQNNHCLKDTHLFWCYYSFVLIRHIDIEMVFTMFFTDFAPFFRGWRKCWMVSREILVVSAVRSRPYKSSPSAWTSS